MAKRNITYTKLTARMALNLAAPHTWPAAIIPALLAACCAAVQGSISISMTFTLLAIVVLMQSAVNTFNDYYDYVKGTDSDEADNVDESDAVLVYNNVNPKSALLLAVGFLAAAFVLGIYCIVVAGWIPLVIALIGAVFVVLYSAGSSPISYLPIGEIVSGVVMGALIPLAAYQVLTGTLDFFMLAKSIPCVIGIGLIMMTNNTSDIERDIEAGRRTLPVLLGREKARSVYHILVIVWIVDIILNVAIWYTNGLVLVPFMLLASYPLLKALFANTLEPQRRLQSMPQILSVNIVLGAFYCASFLAGAVVVPVL